MTHEAEGSGERPEPGPDEVVVTETEPDRYEMTATAELDCAPATLWELLCDWERFVAVGLPGMTRDFRWLSGGPGEAPSTFEFAVGDAVLREEVYELSNEPDPGRYRLSYRALEPALGVLEYDAVLDVRPATAGGTRLDTRRVVRLEPGASPDMLAGMIEGEMQALRDHFASTHETAEPDEGGAAAEIEERIGSYLEQLTLARDAEAARDFYTQDARLLGPGTDLDRAGVLDAIRSAFEAGMELRAERRTLELWVHGDAAYEIARADDTFLSPDGPSKTIRNNLFIRWQKGDDGRWRFARVLLSPRESAAD